MAAPLSHYRSGHGVRRGELNALIRNARLSRIRGAPGQCTSRQERAGAQEQCHGLSRTKVTHELWIAARGLSARRVHLRPVRRHRDMLMSYQARHVEHL